MKSNTTPLIMWKSAESMIAVEKMSDSHLINALRMCLLSSVAIDEAAKEFPELNSAHNVTYGEWAEIFKTELRRRKKERVDARVSEINDEINRLKSNEEKITDLKKERDQLMGITSIGTSAPQPQKTKMM